ncbi:uncharacterized protein CLUP02_17044 [Colletotrichum lupini]|uniref:Uncharacterized protein n=1 Tax=Colletotrichum lupini TaxID=145971 RepID=A0A9Q8WPS5_9PEZI|nr:uncharacterized protein CLUP02_17044 [Colletotrichum lupini]UQC91508.1 hypothetical protein CLUP02_17044 [Colletotrichum lupini]
MFCARVAVLLSRLIARTKQTEHVQLADSANNYEPDSCWLALGASAYANHAGLWSWIFQTVRLTARCHQQKQEYTEYLSTSSLKTWAPTEISRHRAYRSMPSSHRQLLRVHLRQNTTPFTPTSQRQARQNIESVSSSSRQAADDLNKGGWGEAEYLCENEKPQVFTPVESVAPEHEIQTDNILVAKRMQYDHINQISTAGYVMMEENIDTD